jgi:hypothetical protein
MDEPMSRDQRWSPLYQRFNGVMFGFFAGLSHVRAVREQWSELQDQMSRFVSEIELNATIPEVIEDFVGQRHDLFNAIMGLRDELYAFKLAYVLGYGFASTDTTATVEDTEGARRPRTACEHSMSVLGLDPSSLDGRMRNVSNDEKGRPHFDSMMTEGLKLSADLIATCAVEPKTCFVAMPFRHPHPAYYHEIYRVLLEAQGFRCVRAWGGMRNEAHHEMLLTLIDRCGLVFAELTDSNPNVAYELGFATGREKLTLAVMDTNPEMWVSWRVGAQPKKLSNLRGIMVMPYDSAESNWREDFLSGSGSHYVEAVKETMAERGIWKGPEKSKRTGLLSRLFQRLGG